MLLKTAEVKVASSATDSSCSACALLDEGSHRSFITESLARQLRIRVSDYETIALATFSSDFAGTRILPKSTVQIHTSNGPQELSVLIVPCISPPLQNRNIDELMTFEHLRNLHLAPHPRTDQIRIELLIGADAYWRFVGDTIVRGLHGPTAISSNLGGFLVSGPTTTSVLSSLTFVHNILASEPPTNTMDIKQYWDMESLGISSVELEDDGTFDVNQFANSKIEFRDDHYVVGFPWKPNHDPLPTNFAATSARTRAMIHKLSAHEIMEYNILIQEQLRKRFIEYVPECDTSRGHYLPHYGVHKDSTSTPLRIVYCCNAKGKNAPSLNDCLEQGPLLLQNLTAILLRFRIPEVAFTADVEKAFLNIELHEDDRQYTKFLWLSNPADPNSAFQEFQFRTVLFGATCSPFLLNVVIMEHLKKYQSCAIASDLQMNIYVDNLLSGCNAHEAIPYYQNAVKILSEAGFNLRAWSSNDSALVRQAQKDGRLAKDHEVNVLGLRWEPDTDAMCCRPLPPVRKEAPTKRQILSSASKLYDVLGFLSPVHVKLKLLLQQLHLSNAEWDDPLPSEIAIRWQDCYDDLRRASSLAHWPRRVIGLTETTPVTLHGFGDSSTAAYGACVYIVAGAATLVMAKSRLAPKPNEITLPKLELLGAFLCAKLLTFVWEQLQHTLTVSDIVLWSDSKIALSWIRSTKKLPRFVENRCKYIRESIISDYRYCPSTDNPADLLTRGITSDQLLQSNLWWHGPGWLTRGDWPVPTTPHSAILLVPSTTPDEPEVTTSDEEAPDQPERPPNDAIADETINLDSIDVSKVIDIDRFSSMDKLLKCTGYVLRVLDKLRSLRTKSKLQFAGNLTAQEIRNAKHQWIHSVQSSAFLHERSYLLKKRQKSGPLVKQLKLFIDDDGLIRKGGRLENAHLDYDCKYPILLPGKHPFTRLVIKRAHADVMHQGRQATLLRIRRTYWVTKLHTAVKSYVRKCVTCQRVQGRPYRMPVTPPLQKWRISESPPFSVTGVDYTGEIYVKENGEKRKVYICLFTCAVSRAIHLEIVHDNSCNEFMMAFRRFASRKSLPSKIISDNASCFTSASRELKQLFNSPELQEAIAEHGVEWHFIPKRSPWYGGFWERLIGIVKNTLRKVLGRAFVTENELNTLLTEIEASINDRPLTNISTEPGSLIPLTPSQLMTGRLITPLPYVTPDLDDPAWIPTNERESLIERHKKLGELHNHFWSRFRNEYLLALRDKHSWGKHHELTSNQIRIGDMVLVHSDNKKRPLWKTAIVTKLLQSPDGLIRAAEIRTKNGVTNRAIAKLYPLEITHDSSDLMDTIQSETSETTGEKSIDNSVVHQSIRDSVETPVENRPRRKAAIDAAQKIRHIVHSDSSDSE